MCSGTCSSKSNQGTMIDDSVSNRFQEQYSENEAPPEEEEAMKWRMDPDVTFSDWRIEIVTKGEQGHDCDSTPCCNDGASVKTYHVHKCHLAVGSRRSEYFSKLFRNANNFKEAKNCTSQIKLDPVAATCFPRLLDYIYAPERPLQITTETATALHHLGEYFEMRKLRWDAKQFIQQDVSMKNAEVYYKHATLFQDEAILGIVAEFLGKNIKRVSPSSAIVKQTNPELWQRAADQVDPANAGHWSRVVSEIGLFHRDNLDSNSFEGLTKASRMPQVHADVALDLCDVEDTLQSRSDCQGEPPDIDLSSLQERCATALSKKWKDWDTSNERTLASLKQRKAAFLVDLLLKCLEECRLEVKQVNEKLEKATSVIGKFQPFPYNETLCGGSVLVPEEIIAHNPDLHGSTCRQYSHNFAPTGYSEYWLCPVFFYAECKIRF